MNTSELLQALQCTLGTTQQEIMMAEQALNKAKTIQGYVPNLLLIACDKNVNELIRQSAIVNLATEVKYYWDPQPEHDHIIPDVDRDTLKESILDALIKCTDAPKIYKQMELIILHVAESDFPGKWQSILPNVVERLRTSQKFNEILGSLLALKNIVENYEYQLEKEREPLELLVPNTFPILDSYAKNLLSNYNEPAALAMNTILKTFLASIRLMIPKYLMEEKILDNWMYYFKLLLDKPLPEELETLTNDRKVLEQREKNIYWINKKWCAKIVDAFIYRYSERKYERKENQGIAELFHRKYAIPFLETFSGILFRQKDHYSHSKVQYFALRYIYRALKFTNMSGILHEQMENIMFTNLIPSLFLTPKDEDDWNENPIEFIRKEEDVSECSNNIKRILRDLWIRICDMNLAALDGELLLIKFMKYAAYVLTNDTDPRTNQTTDLRMKEAILHIIGVLSKPITKNEALKSNMEYLLHKYVVPEFQNTIGFLRARACWLFGIYGGLEYENKQILADAAAGLYKCLVDTQLPVQVKAGIALNQVLQQEEVIQILKPGLSSILESYIKLISDIDDDELVLALEGIVQVFRNEIQPFALEIINHLANIFFQANKDDPNDVDSSANGEEDEKQMGAAGCLSTIATVLKAGLPKEALFKSEDIVIPILELAFTQKYEEFTEEGLHILSAITYHSETISQKMWTYFLELNYMIIGKPDENQSNQGVGWAFEYINDMIPCFQNYIQKGRDVIFAVKDPYYHIAYIELLFKSIEKLYDICYDSQNDVEMVIGSVLYITLIENYPRQIDDIVGYILDKMIVHLPKAKSIMMRRMIIQIVSMCLWYDTRYTLQHLQNKQATEYILKCWIELFPHFKHDFELRRLLFGLASLLQVNMNELPSVITGSLVGFLQQMVRLTSEILRLRDKEDSEEGEEAEEDPDEDYKKLVLDAKEYNQKKNTPTFVDKDDFNQYEHQLEDDDDDDLDDYENLDWLNSSCEYDSPIAEQCEILYLRDSLSIMQKNNAEYYDQLITCLTEEEKDALRRNFETAQIQELEFQKMKQEKALKVLN